MLITKQFSTLTLYLAGSKYPLLLEVKLYTLSISWNACWFQIVFCIVIVVGERFCFVKKNSFVAYFGRFILLIWSTIGVKILLKSGNLKNWIKIRKWHHNDVMTLISFFGIKQIWVERLKTGQSLKLVSFVISLLW